jgi:uncharacterized protein YndB with AHSA1/START domain
MSEQPPQGRTLDLTVDLPATPDEVWRMLTDPKLLAQWFAPFVEGTGKVGEPLLLGWSPGLQWKTLLTVSEPGKRVVFRDELAAYQEMGPTSGPMVIEWTMGPIAGGTRLRLVHSGFGDGASWDEMYDGTAAGWGFCLWHLGETLLRHRGQPRVTLSARRSSTLSRDALGSRLFGPEGFALKPPRKGEASVQLDRPRTLLVEHAGLPRNLWGRLPELNDALLMVEMEPGGGTFHTGIWMSTWGLGAAREKDLQAALDRLADRVFGAVTPA